jgi:hypothetical protein
MAVALLGMQQAVAYPSPYLKQTTSQVAPHPHQRNLFMAVYAIWSIMNFD